MGSIINIREWDQSKYSQQEAREMVIIHNNETYRYFDEGLSRFVYVNEDKTKVVKLDKEKYGGKWNELENNIYQNASEENREQMVKTKLINGLIEQEFVEPIKFSKKPMTIKQQIFASRCRDEVGWKGDKLLCYDLDEFKKY